MNPNVSAEVTRLLNQLYERGVADAPGSHGIIAEHALCRGVALAVFRLSSLSRALFDSGEVTMGETVDMARDTIRTLHRQMTGGEDVPPTGK